MALPRKTPKGCCPRCKQPYPEGWAEERKAARLKGYKEAMAERKAQGLKMGRPVGEARIKRDAGILYLKNVSKKSQREIAQIMGIGQSVVQHVWDKDNREKEIQTTKTKVLFTSS